MGAPMRSIVLRVSLDRILRLTGARRINRFLALPSADRRLLCEALLTVLLVRAALWVLPLRMIHGRLVRLGPVAARRPAIDVDRLSRAVGIAAKRVPAASCLTQALALQALVRRRGSSSRVRVGFRLEPSGELSGHAWLERDGEVLIGGGRLDEFRTLLKLEG
jgi:hypothetical protein